MCQEIYPRTSACNVGVLALGSSPAETILEKEGTCGTSEEKVCTNSPEEGVLEEGEEGEEVFLLESVIDYFSDGDDILGTSEVDFVSANSDGDSTLGGRGGHAGFSDALDTEVITELSGGDLDALSERGISEVLDALSERGISEVSNMVSQKRFFFFCPLG